MDRSLFTSLGLRENPFSVNPDPRHLFLTAQTQQALDGLIRGIESRQGLILLTGDVGTGKTTLVNSLFDWLQHHGTPKAFICNSHLEIQELFELMLADFGVPGGVRGGSAFSRLQGWLHERLREGQTAVLVIDEAQGLPSHTLEEIRLLLNLETPNGKLLQIVLSGQPELEHRLRRADLRQIHQRISFRCRTIPMTLEETRACIQHRLRVAGAGGEPIFSPEAMDSAYFYSRGIPRVINLLCEHALLKAHAGGIQPVPASMIEEASRELQFDADRPVAPMRWAEAVVPRANLIPMQPASNNSKLAFAAAAGSSMDRHQDTNPLRVGDLAAINPSGRIATDKTATQSGESPGAAGVMRKTEVLAVEPVPSAYANAFGARAQKNAHDTHSMVTGAAAVGQIIAELSRDMPAAAPIQIRSAGPTRTLEPAAAMKRELIAVQVKLRANLAIFDARHRAELARRILEEARSLRSRVQRLSKRTTAKVQPVLARLTSSFVFWLKEPVPLAPFNRVTPTIREASGETDGRFSWFANNLRERAELVLRWLQTPARPAQRR
jgi:general secretion pathway protein A